MKTPSKTYLHVPHGRFLIRFIVVVLLLACSSAVCILDQRRTQSEMGAILSAFFSDQVLHDLRYWPAGREIQIVLLREPQSGPFPGGRSLLFDPRSSFSQSSRTTRASFFLSNVFSTNIGTELHLPGRTQAFFINRKEVQGTKPIDFQTNFPNNFGYFAVSHIGLNPSKTEAVLYVDHFCGGLCGGGGYFLMRKVNGVWHVVDQHNTWMA
jgi:hypothetical protein